MLGIQTKKNIGLVFKAILKSQLVLMLHCILVHFHACVCVCVGGGCVPVPLPLMAFLLYYCCSGKMPSLIQSLEHFLLSDSISLGLKYPDLTSSLTSIWPFYPQELQKLPKQNELRDAVYQHVWLMVSVNKLLLQFVSAAQRSKLSLPCGLLRCQLPVNPEHSRQVSTETASGSSLYVRTFYSSSFYDTHLRLLANMM